MFELALDNSTEVEIEQRIRKGVGLESGEAVASCPSAATSGLGSELAYRNYGVEKAANERKTPRASSGEILYFRMALGANQ